MTNQTKNQPIAIIGAMEEEVAFLRKKLTNQTIQTHAKIEFYIGQLESQEIVLVKSGIGKVNATIATSLLLQLYKPKFVINTGSAGGFDKDLNVGDVVIGDSVFYHDFDLTPFGYKNGQVPNMPEKFAADTKLVDLAQSIISQDNNQTKIGAIGSGDRFVHNPKDVDEIKQKFPSMIACEMEAGAIAHTCFLFQTPFVVIRAISDVAGKENAIAFEEFLPIAAKNSSDFVVKFFKLANSEVTTKNK
jgi:adenosylhomocysteine nucleosidase